jgi:predicted HD phosphohydrolase
MLRGILPVLKHNDWPWLSDCATWTSTVDERALLGDQVLTQISAKKAQTNEDDAGPTSSRSPISMEQIGDIIERVLQDIEDKKIRKGAPLLRTPAWPDHPHLKRLISDSWTGWAVNLVALKRCSKRKALFTRTGTRIRRHPHPSVCRNNFAQSIETLGLLHIDLISDLKSTRTSAQVAYPILESAGALTRETRIRISRKRVSLHASPNHTPCTGLPDIELLFARHGASQYSESEGRPLSSTRVANSPPHEQSDADDALVPPACCLLTSGVAEPTGPHGFNDLHHSFCASTDTRSTTPCPFCAACAMRCSTPSKLHVDAKRYLCCVNRRLLRAARWIRSAAWRCRGGVFSRRSAGCCVPENTRTAHAKRCAVAPVGQHSPNGTGLATPSLTRTFWRAARYCVVRARRRGQTRATAVRMALTWPVVLWPVMLFSARCCMPRGTR